MLDLCCGTGDLTLALAAEIRVVHRIVIRRDSRRRLRTSHARARTGEGRTAPVGAAIIEFLEADALALPFADQSFDLVTTAFGFRKLANYAEGLAELRRVLRPGGSVAILEFAEPEGVLFRPRFPVSIFTAFFRS